MATVLFAARARELPLYHPMGIYSEPWGPCGQPASQQYAAYPARCSIYSAVQPSAAPMQPNTAPVQSNAASVQPILVLSQPIMVSKQPIMVSRQPIVASRQPLVVSRQQLIASNQPPVVSRQPSCGVQVAKYDAQTANCGAQTASELPRQHTCCPDTSYFLERNGTDLFGTDYSRNGTEWIYMERISFGNGTEQNGSFLQ